MFPSLWELNLPYNCPRKCLEISLNHMVKTFLTENNSTFLLPLFFKVPLHFVENFNFLVKGIFIGIEMGLSDACHFLKCFEVWIFSMYQESKSLWIEYTNGKFRISRSNLHYSYKSYTSWARKLIIITVNFCANSFVTTIYYTYQWQGKDSNSKVLKIMTGTQCR